MSRTSPSSRVQPEFRPAEIGDISALLEIETACFDTDRLSQRSFKSLIKPGSHSLTVLIAEDQIAGYSLILFRRGTCLARLYSIAVHPHWRGQGFARQLLIETEAEAKSRDALFLRLEVREDNLPAITLYEQLSYRQFDTVDEYYEDGGRALRFEKRLTPKLGIRATKAPDYYGQTTEFSCGPAALMMAMHDLQNDYVMSRQEELQIWREATTIFMTSGHGGCSPHGLALSALRRGFKPTLYINTNETPFRDSVRQESKREVIDLVHQDFLRQLRDYQADIEFNPLGSGQVRQLLEQNDHIIALISTWALDRNQAPHWVYIRRSDNQYVYINDPDNKPSTKKQASNSERWPSDSDYRHVPIKLDAFISMASFGRRRLRCLLVINKAI